MLARLPLLFLLPAFALSSPPVFREQDVLVHTQDIKVPVTLGVMSRDPDALFCHRVFDQVRDRVGHKMSTSLVYVANLDEEERTYGVRCANGPQECAGSIQQLCVAKYVPQEWWHFVHCQNFEGSGKVGSPNVAFKCANAAGFDWESSGVGGCAGMDASGATEEGIRLLQENVKRGKEIGIEKSCTILINSEQVCIHDGIWRECVNSLGGPFRERLCTPD